jgi:hypothetical protein
MCAMRSPRSNLLRPRNAESGLLRMVWGELAEGVGVGEDAGLEKGSRFKDHANLNLSVSISWQHHVSGKCQLL